VLCFEVIFLCRCIPIATRAPGSDDCMWEPCVLVEPLNIEQKRGAIQEVLSWPEEEYVKRQSRLVPAARQYQCWHQFRAGVQSARNELLETPANAR
jgi:hypothetical protein